MVRLLRSVEQNGRLHPAGLQGAVVRVYDEGEAYLVETSDDVDGLLTLGSEDIEVIADDRH